MKSDPDVAKQKYWSEKKTKGERAKSLANLLADLYYGDENEIVSAETNLAGANDNIQKITRTPTGVIITYMTGNTSPELSFKDVSGNLKTVEDFISGAYTSFGRKGEDVFEGQDYKDVIRGAGINKSRVFNNETTVERGVQVAESEQEKAIQYIDSITYDSKADQTVGDVVNEVKSFVNKIPNLGGIQVEYDGSAGVDILDGKTVIGNFLTNSKGLEQAIDALKNYAKSPTKLTENAAKLINVQSKGTGGTGQAANF